MPNLVYEQTPDLLDNLWTAMRDPKVAIREVAANALSGCLSIAFERESPARQEWCNLVYEQASKGLKLNTSDSIHGSLLGYQELFLRAGMVRFLDQRTSIICSDFGSTCTLDTMMSANRFYFTRITEIRSFARPSSRSCQPWHSTITLSLLPATCTNA